MLQNPEHKPIFVVSNNNNTAQAFQLKKAATIAVQ